MPAKETRRARRYRRLLLCYPRGYRRERGEEIVDTMLELSAPERGWSAARLAANLICHGLRCRLGRPASRTVVVWAVLTAVVCGLFTAAFATRLGWETSRPLPSRGEAKDVFRTAFPDYQYDGVGRDPALFVLYAEPLGPQHVDDLLLGDGGEYQPGVTGIWMEGKPIDQPHALAVAQKRLRAAGWTIAEPIAVDAVECADERCDRATPPQDVTLTARRGDTYIEVEFSGEPVDTTPDLSISLYRAAPPVTWPAGIAGGLLGAVAGWLLFGWASRRTEGRHLLLRVPTTFLYGTTMLLWGGPLLFTLPLSLQHHLEEPHLLWHPLWEWLGQPDFSLFFLVGGGAALAGLAIAAMPTGLHRTTSTTAAH